VAVAETGSFSEAARRLELPKSSVSRGVASLEAWVGAPLLHRTTRHVSLSTAGAALYERAAPLLASLKEAVGTLPEREEGPSGELRLTAPHDMGATFLPEVIARFTAPYPSVRVDCRLTNRNVDFRSRPNPVGAERGRLLRGHVYAVGGGTIFRRMRVRICSSRLSPRCCALSFSASRVRGGPFASSESKSRVMVAVMSSTAFSKAFRLEREGSLIPLSFRTYCRAASRISSLVAGGSK
jgi:molybdenum-dependent DNA-binding transcriptional regulator ModE